MQISYLWLKELTGLDWSAEEMAERLTLAGIANEEIVPTAKYLDKVIVGHVEEVHPVEGASKLTRTVVNTGTEKLQVVCGAPNVAPGQKVPVALVGARVAGGMEIKRARIRGVDSAGMICAEEELGLSTDHSGIMVLDPSAPVGVPLKEYLEHDDYILGFELTPNRGDAWSAIGIARDLAALGGVRVRRPEVHLREAADKAAGLVTVQIDDPVGCPRYAARVINGVKIAQSPWWIRRKLLTAGVRPINNVVDITNLVMLECGNPLHAFDLDRFGSREVVVRRARKSEKFVTLDGQARVLSEHVLLITNGREPVAAAGIMGGLNSEVVDTTSQILLEAAYFDPMVVRKGRKELGMVTESSARFERGVDPNNIPWAIDRAAALFQDVCGGEVLAGRVDCYPKPVAPKQITLRPDRCCEIMGTPMSAGQMQGILNALEFNVTGISPIQVEVPTFRSDISREIDLVEEVARIHGWSNIPDSVENIGPLYSPANAEDTFEQEIRRVLTGVGFDEILGHGLADGRLAEQMYPDLPQVRLTNPVSDELSIMRNSLIPSALAIIGHNFSHRIAGLRVFELGRAYFPPTATQDFREEERCSLAVSGVTPGSWRDKSRPLDFYDLKAAVDSLSGHFHWPTLEFEPSNTTFFESGTGISLKANGRQVGVMGQVTGTLARRFDIRQELFVGELYLGALMELGQRWRQFTPLPVYPAAPRDLAILVAQAVRVGDLISRIKSVAGELAESVTVFDLYWGKQIGEGNKSVGVAIVYRSPDRSLSGEEVDKMQARIIAALKEEFKAEIREK